MPLKSGKAGSLHLHLLFLISLYFYFVLKCSTDYAYTWGMCAKIILKTWVLNPVKMKLLLDLCMRFLYVTRYLMNSFLSNPTVYPLLFSFLKRWIEGEDNSCFATVFYTLKITFGSQHIGTMDLNSYLMIIYFFLACILELKWYNICYESM